MAEWVNGVRQYGNGIKLGVFAYLTGSETTTVTTAATYYPIAGTFANSPANGFQTVADPAIEYTYAETKYFEIDCHATLSADDNGRTVHIALKKNGVLVDASIMGTYLKTADEPQAVSGTCVLSLAKGDKIQLIVTSSTNLDVINFQHFTTSIREFY
ncbi:MAG: hypothetical protein GY841_10395 [FCB group bacterium]|nr:hypothetical protein [FCB group bacterium]